MAAQNLITQTLRQLSGGAAASGMKSGRGKPQISFGQVMSQNLNQGSADKKVEKQPAVKDSAAKEDDTPVKETDGAAKKEKLPVKKEDTAVQGPKKETKEKEEITGEETGDLQKKILETVSRILNIPQEQLKAAMEEMGLKPEDLTDPSHLAELLMKVKGVADPMALLTDETCSAQMKELTRQLQQLADTAKENGKQLFKMPEDGNSVKPESAPSQDAPEEAKLLHTAAKEAGTPVENEASGKEKEISVTVSREGNHQGAVEKNAEKGQSFGQEQSSRREQGNETQQTPIGAFVENLAVKGQQSGNAEAAAQKLEMMQNIVKQVVEQIKVSIKPETTSMELQLNPENLGKINLTVASKNGQLTATITTQNEFAREALESQMQILKDNLSNQGLKVEAVEVAVSNSAFDFKQNSQAGNGENKPKQQGKRRIDLKSFEDLKGGLSEEEALLVRMMEQNGQSVDYTA